MRNRAFSPSGTVLVLSFLLVACSTKPAPTIPPPYVAQATPVLEPTTPPPPSPAPTAGPWCDCVQIWSVEYPTQVQVGQYVTIRWHLCTQASGVGHNNLHWGAEYCGNDPNGYPNTTVNEPGQGGWYQDGFVAPSAPGTICFIIHASAGPSSCQQAQAGVYQIHVVQ